MLTDYVNLIMDESGELLRNLFAENVRDFLGNNMVNTEVSNTINDSTQKDRFVILNNGITIVAEEIRTTANDFTISNFQIVNGCQTSHILYNNKDKLTPNMFIPVKIVETNDTEVMINITKATNRQSAVNDEAFESLKPYQKELEEYYKVMVSKLKIKPEIYYARRTKQYLSIDNISQTQVVTLPAQIKSFLSLVFEEPHYCHRYYGQLLIENSKRLFQNNHSKLLYFFCGLASSKLYSYYFDNQEIPRLIRRNYIYHTLLIFKYLYIMEGIGTRTLFDKKAESKILEIIDLLNDTSKASLAFNKSVKIVVDKLDQFGNYSAYKSKEFTQLLLDKDFATDDYYYGQIAFYNSNRGFGYISYSYGSDSIFFHVSELSNVALEYGGTIEYGTRVKFKKGSNAKGECAVQIEKI